MSVPPQINPTRALSRSTGRGARDAFHAHRALATLPPVPIQHPQSRIPDEFSRVIMKRSAIAALFLASAASAATSSPQYVDPVPHDLITQPYRICQDLDELTARINNLYRKPFPKLFDATGAGQSECV